MTDFVKARRYMVDCQIRPADVTDHALLAAFDAVERERFLPEALRPIAYLDRQLDVGGGRQLLTPMTFAKLAQALALTKGGRVLDVACGAGYSSAVLAQVAGAVTGLESDAGLAHAAQANVAAAGLTNVVISSGRLDQLPAGEGFDAILINGAVEFVPDAWLAALKNGGRIACVRGSGRSAQAILVTKSGGQIGERVLFDAAAPMLVEFTRKPEFAF